MAANDGTRPALLFIPDISGFTQFVSATEISHSQHIITELLQAVIESNQLGMTVCEIEGDAIFFYKAETIPAPEQIAEQCRKTFIAFHQQLKKYDLLRICNCGACSTAGQLTLKIVAHQGNVSFMNINNQTKLFGPDVILIHRLLKNDIPEHEYMLLTERIPVEKISADKKEHQWIQFEKGSNNYDVGNVNYNFSPFKSLYDSIPEPVKPELKVYRVKNPALFIIDIHAPMSHVYSELINLKGRLQVLPGITEVKIEDEKHNQMNKLGTVHECIREPATGAVETTNVVLEENKMICTETSMINPMSLDYVVEKTGKETCRLTFQVHLALPFIQKIMFSLMMKKKLVEQMNMSLDVIKEHCEKTFQQEKEHAHEGVAHVH